MLHAFFRQLVIALISVIIDQQPYKTTRQVKEAIWIRKTKTPMNRDEGSYELPHVHHDVIRH